MNYRGKEQTTSDEELLGEGCRDAVAGARVLYCPEEAPEPSHLAQVVLEVCCGFLGSKDQGCHLVRSACQWPCHQSPAL